jgi:hypothetical protein
MAAAMTAAVLMLHLQTATNQEQEALTAEIRAQFNELKAKADGLATEVRKMAAPLEKAERGDWGGWVWWEGEGV